MFNCDELKRPSEAYTQYFAALSGACLCVEPEILRMIEEWSPQKLHQRFQQAPVVEEKDLLPTIQGLFERHVSSTMGGDFPSTTGPLKERTAPQLMAIYLMNSIVLQALVCGHFSFDCETWKYCAEFIRMNVPGLRRNNLQPIDAKGAAFATDPSEEILLKFMAMFTVDASEGIVKITARRNEMKFENRSLLDARMELFSFLQNDTDRLFYSVHDPSCTLEEKQTRIEWLNEKGMRLGYESRIVKAYEMLGRNKEVGMRQVFQELIALVKTIRSQGFDGITFINWLLCFRHLASGKEFLNCSGNPELLQLVTEVTQEILRYDLWPNKRYQEHTLLIWIDTVKKLGAESVFFLLLEERGYRELSGRSFYAVVMALAESRRCAQYKRDIVPIELSDVLNGNRTPKWDAAYILMAEWYANKNWTNQLCRDVRRSIPALLNKYTKVSNYRTLTELPTLLRACLQIGAFLPAKKYLNNVKITDKIFFGCTGYFTELLEIEELVGADGVSRMLQNIKGYPFFSLRDFTLPVCIVRRRLSLEGVTQTTGPMLKQAIEGIFKCDSLNPVEEAKLLIEVAKRMDFQNTGDQTEIALLSSMRNLFAGALREAVNDFPRYPIHLMSELFFYAIKYGIFSMDEIAEWYIVELDMAINIADKRCEDSLRKTFALLVDEVGGALEEELRARFLYIGRVFPDLANDIDTRYPEKFY